MGFVGAGGVITGINGVVMDPNDGVREKESELIRKYSTLRRGA
jgi:hypothetical protein